MNFTVVGFWVLSKLALFDGIWVRLSRWQQVSLYPYSVKQIVTLNQKIPQEIDNRLSLKIWSIKPKCNNWRIFWTFTGYFNSKVDVLNWLSLFRNQQSCIGTTYFISILMKNSLTLDYFQNIWQNRFLSLWGRRSHLIWDFWVLVKSKQSRMVDQALISLLTTIQI